MLKPYPELLVDLAAGQSPLQDAAHAVADAACTGQLVGHTAASGQLDAVPAVGLESHPEQVK